MQKLFTVLVLGVLRPASPSFSVLFCPLTVLNYPLLSLTVLSYLSPSLAVLSCPSLSLATSYQHGSEIHYVLGGTFFTQVFQNLLSPLLVQACSENSWHCGYHGLDTWWLLASILWFQWAGAQTYMQVPSSELSSELTLCF